MKNKFLRSRKGFTLLEVLIAMGILSVVMALAFSMLLFGNRLLVISENEYNFQFATRMALYSTSDSIRYSTAVFTIPKSSFRADNLDTDWDYIGIVETAEGQEIVKYTYNNETGVHDATVLVPARSGVKFLFTFTKVNPADEDSLLQFSIQTIPAGSVDEYGRPKPDLTVTSEVEALNSLQVIDLSTVSDPAVAIAFKPDERKKTVVGHISFVMDVSASMADTLDGHSAGYHGASSRISILQAEAKTLINKFAQEDNIDIALIPFETSANTSQYYTHAFRNAKTATAQLITDINNLRADGGTNTGDGLRRAYYALQTHNAEARAIGNTPSNYLIILVDGVTTFASVISDRNRTFVTADGNVDVSGYLDRGRDEYSPTSQIAGNGSTLDPAGTAYVNAIGHFYKDHSFAKVYVIGFSSLRSELESVNDIAEACSTSSRVFTADSSDALNTVFSEIQQDIVQDLWYLQGPNL